jgi:hypothetical protein
LTSAYLFRDADYVRKTFKSDVGREFIKMAKDQLGIQVITPVYFGSYQPSPKGLSGRPAHCPFRGLLGVHSRCGLHTRAVTNS